mgnify:CR=1 FL=1
MGWIIAALAVLGVGVITLRLRSRRARHRHDAAVWGLNGETGEGMAPQRDDPGGEGNPDSGSGESGGGDGEGGGGD